MSQKCNQDKELKQYECRSLASMIIMEAQHGQETDQRHHSRFGNAEELKHLKKRACAKGDLLEVVF